MTALPFPEGRRGQVAAVALLVAALAAAWVGIAAPVATLYGDRANALAERRAFADHLRVLAAALPILKASAATRPPDRRLSSAGLSGATDALAAASLQKVVGQIATATSVTVSSTDVTTPQNSPWGRRIGVTLRVSGSYHAIIAFVTQVLLAQPKMVVDDLELHDGGGTTNDPDKLLDGGLTVFGFRTNGGGA